ncbi:tRNA1(Val) A37 N6-methylase TrmN6 [Palleronia salina]|uniref:tRNA1(Val) A37 N6-methylase TrmN6 n=1 Tax=Palleronia salina TaxID=313368 RepID=A0A1M6END0_9RHOB|nr:methyltransferase domain-containing protein [Palleronia salina]SHI86909.1 tRNA1(Val) A37 N6-methylase TrmN6 [Palleronia salina]
MSTSDAETTCDAFLGGRLVLEQPRKGYRAGVDPVLLAAAVPARAGQSVLELGCGVGCALFALANRVEGLDLTGVELQDEYAALARANAARNGLTAQIHTADLADLPEPVRQRRFDHVVANPPYYAPRSGTPPRGADRATAHREDLPLARWIETGARRLAPKGLMTVIQRADRLADLLGAMAANLGSLEVRPLQPRTGRAASLVIVSGRKGGKTPLVLHPPIVMHDGASHGKDGEDYAPAIRGVLRDGAALP